MMELLERGRSDMSPGHSGDPATAYYGTIENTVLAPSELF